MMGVLARLRRQPVEADSLPDLWAPRTDGVEDGPANLLRVVISTAGEAMAWGPMDGLRPEFRDGQFTIVCDDGTLVVRRAGRPSHIALVAVSANGVPQIINDHVGCDVSDDHALRPGETLNMTGHGIILIPNLTRP